MPNNLRTIRQQKGFRIMQLVSVSGVSSTTICSIENYGYAPKKATRDRIAGALGVPTGDIWPAAQPAATQEVVCA